MRAILMFNCEAQSRIDIVHIPQFWRERERERQRQRQRETERDRGKQQFISIGLRPLENERGRERERERERAEAESNRGPSNYQLNALLLCQAGSRTHSGFTD